MSTEYAMTFNAWMLAYLQGEETAIHSRNFAPDGPFFRALPQPPWTARTLMEATGRREDPAARRP
ncbi:hypothetical protein [Streptomyces jumonjinensis]|uniref:Uncharacterized protein n=1 Tax=Streptomyces jumonjinensis TaxID=1945 RepID=A0A646KTE6_STRJU|nr:hypothetical protein [Streptomyces jumonjinensis]MQT05317.1 hypothetical protein [Streptomyces jumonjinensis]